MESGSIEYFRHASRGVSVNRQVLVSAVVLCFLFLVVLPFFGFYGYGLLIIISYKDYRYNNYLTAADCAPLRAHHGRLNRGCLVFGVDVGVMTLVSCDFMTYDSSRTNRCYCLSSGACVAAAC